MHTRCALVCAAAAAFALALTPAAHATFTGVAIDEVTGTLPPAPNLPNDFRVFRMYALFDGLGGPSGAAAANTVRNELALSLFGINARAGDAANFFQADVADGASPNDVGGPNLAVANSRGLYDTYLSIGLVAQDSSAGIIDATSASADFDLFNGNFGAGDPALGLGMGDDRFRGLLFIANPPSTPQCWATFNAAQGRFEVFMAQFAIGNLPASVDLGSYNGASFVTDVFYGNLTIVTPDNLHAVSFGSAPGVPSGLQPPLPSPGSIALFVVGGAPLARRRRSKRR